MSRQRSARSRRRRDERVPALTAVLVVAALLVVLNVLPGWEALPVLTPAAESAVAMLNLALIVLLVSRAVALVEPSPRVRAAARYLIALISLALLADLWATMPVDFGSNPDPWVSATRLVLAGLLVWAVLAGARAAVAIVRGRQSARLSASHA